MLGSLEGPGSTLEGSTAPCISCQEELCLGGVRTRDASLFVQKRPWLGCLPTNKNQILLQLLLLSSICHIQLSHTPSGLH